MTTRPMFSPFVAMLLALRAGSNESAPVRDDGVSAQPPPPLPRLPPLPPAEVTRIERAVLSPIEMDRVTWDALGEPSNYRPPSRHYSGDPRPPGGADAAKRKKRKAAQASRRRNRK